MRILRRFWGIVSDTFEIYWTTTNPIAFTKAFYDCATDGNFGKGLDLCKDIVSLSIVLTPFFHAGTIFYYKSAAQNRQANRRKGNVDF